MLCEDRMVLPSSQIRNQLREVKCLAWGHTACKLVNLANRL